MIPQAFIDEVQSRTDIAELIASYIPLKRTGRNFKALCPFHSEKTPSFIISPQKQIFHCFGCGEGGGVFQFLTLIEKVTFPEAVEILAKKNGLAVPYQQDRASKVKTVLYEALAEAAAFFNRNLKDSRDCSGVREYLKQRGVDQNTIDQFRLGFAFGNNTLISYMRKKGFTLEILEKASLITPGRAGFRDLFNNRIIFPIFDVRSRIIAFGGRLYRERSDSPKYINSLESALYSKRDHLFGLNFSKENIVKEGTIVVGEGYLDMITPFMRGIKNIVASLGTALTLEQIRLIKRYALKVILVYDSDPAGQNATLRSVDLLLEGDLKVKVVNLPAGYDPDSLAVKKGKDYFLKLLENSLDFFEYKLNILKMSHDRKSIEGKTAIAKDVLATVNKLSSEIEKYEYIRKLAVHLGVKEEIVIAEFEKTFSKGSRAYEKRRGFSDRPQDSPFHKHEPLSVTEKVLLKFMLTNPKAYALARKNLKEEYFNSYLARKTISFLFQDSSFKDVPIEKLLGTVRDKEVSGFISEILMDEDIPSDKDTFKESLLKLRKKGAVELKRKLQDKIRDAESRGDKEALRELLNKFTQIK